MVYTYYKLSFSEIVWATLGKSILFFDKIIKPGNVLLLVIKTLMIIILKYNYTLSIYNLQITYFLMRIVQKTTSYIRL